jgi:excisionase family DNA binding protein
MAAAHEFQTASTLLADFGDDDALLTVDDTARLLKVSVTWVYEHVRPDTDDRLPFVKLGKYLRFDRRDLQAFIDAKRGESRRQPRRR